MAKRGRSRRQTGKPKERRLSVMVIHRIKDTMALVSSIEAHKERLVRALTERYGPRLRGDERLPDWDLALELTARDVKAALRRLIELDDKVAFASVDQDELRLQLNRLVGDELQPRAVAVRGAIDLAFGRERGARLHGMKGRTRRKAPALERQLRRTVSRLTDPKRELPPPKNPHAIVDREGWIRQLRPGYLELVKLRRRIGLGEQALSVLVSDKQAAMEAFDAAYGDALRYVRSVFKMARFDSKLLDNLRPYYQRRRLSRRAKKARETRAAAAAADAAKPVPVKPRPPAKEKARVPVPKTVVQWLEKSRLFGT